jgi:diguanylate cyclase
MEENQPLERRQIEAGDVLLREGEPASCAFLIHQGKVKITKNHRDKTLDIAELGPGDIVGEMSLLAGKGHSATATVIEEGSVIVVEAVSLEEKYKASDPIMRKIVFCLVNRLYRSNEEIMRLHFKEE